jgi:hypothetical protein
MSRFANAWRNAVIGLFERLSLAPHFSALVEIGRI